MATAALIGISLASAATQFAGAEQAADAADAQSARSREQQALAERDEIRQIKLAIGAREADPGGGTAGTFSIADSIEDMRAQGLENLSRIASFGEGERDQISAQKQAIRLGAVRNVLSGGAQVASSAFPSFQDTGTGPGTQRKGNFAGTG